MSIRLMGWLLATLLMASGTARQEGGLAPLGPIAGTRHFVYMSDQRVVTVELVNTRRAILNYINLGTTYELIEAPLLAIVDAAGQVRRGHVIEVEPPVDPGQRFVVSDLLPPHRFKGYTILGDLGLTSAAEKAYFKTGGRILEFDPVSAEDFDTVAAAVPRIDLTREDTKTALLLAGFRRGYGRMHFAGAEGASRLEGNFPDVEVLPPVLLAAPRPALPASALGVPDPVVVELKATVTRAGGLSDVKVSKGVNATLDEIATETVRNSWKFLPAISKGQVTGASLTLKVVFERR